MQLFAREKFLPEFGKIRPVATIKIKTKAQEDGWIFEVVVLKNGTQTRHQVTMSKNFYERLQTKVSPEKVVQKSFEFLLEREPKESILGQFDITVISHYFPEYEKEIKARL